MDIFEQVSTFGQALDKYLDESFDTEIQTVFIYLDKQSSPHVIVTESRQDYDWTKVFTSVHDLNLDIAGKKREVERLQVKIRELEKDKKQIENTLKKIAGFSGNQPNTPQEG